MNLTRLALQNFRNVEFAEFDLTRSMFFLGMNGQGKSTILNAVQIALHGWCEHTDRRGAGYRDLIRDGAKQAVIELDFDAANMGPHRISYTLGLAARQWELIDTTTGEIREAITTPAALWTALGIDQTHATVCMFPTQIVNAPEFAGILSSYLSDALKHELLAARIPAEHRAALTALAARKHVALDSVTGFESLGKICYEQRTMINRDLKLVDAVIAETGFLKPAVLPDGTVLKLADMAALEAKRAAYTAELNALRVELGRAIQATTQAPIDVEALTVELASHKAVLAVAEAAKAAILADTQAQQDMDDARNAQHAAERNKQKAEATRDAVATDCPTCKRKLTPAMRKELIAEAQLAVDAADQVLGTADATVEAKGAAWRAVEYKGDPSEVVESRRSWAAQEIRRIEIALRDQAPTYAGRNEAEIETAIRTVTAADADTATALAALNRHRELAEAEAQANALRAQLAPIAVGITEFHDGTAYRALLASAAGSIVAAVNERISGTLDVRAEGKAFVLLYNGRPLSLASRGQRATVAYAMAETFAACGAPVLLDDTNDLDPLNRGALCMRVRQAATGTVLLAGTPNSVEPEYPARLAAVLTPMSVVVVSDGRYTLEGAA